MPNPIGISFMPSQENAAFGPQRGAMEGDLQQAWKILSLRLPRVLGARSPISRDLLSGPGSSGMPGNPNAAMALRAMIEAMPGMGGGGFGGGPQTPPYVPPTKPKIDMAPLPGGDVDPRGGGFERRGPMMGGRQKLAY